jgi:hypothetical protein
MRGSFDGNWRTLAPGLTASSGLQVRACDLRIVLAPFVEQEVSAGGPETIPCKERFASKVIKLGNRRQNGGTC